MFTRRALLGFAAGAAVGSSAKIAESHDPFPDAAEVTARGRVTQTLKRYATIDVGTDKVIYVTPMTQAYRDLNLKIGDEVEVTWQELRDGDEEDVFEAFEVRLA